MNNPAPAAPESVTPIAPTVPSDGVSPALQPGTGAVEARHPVALHAAWFWGGVSLIAVVSLLSLSLAWKSQQRLGDLEQELVRRQQSSQGQSAEAQMLAKQAQESVREAAAKVALLEARVAEVAVQRSQLEELIQSLSRSRDENLLVDIEAGIRVALQQAAITGSAEPLVLVLKQADERLARYNQPRLERVRRAIVRDLDRAKSAGIVDVASLTIKLDEVVRLVDELPLLSSAKVGRAAESAALVSAESSRKVDRPALNGEGGSWFGSAWLDGGRELAQQVWAEVKSLVRVTRIDHPEAMLLAPEQAFFLRENLKLRLLNARLAILSRQFDTAQADLQGAQVSLERYFERASRRTVLAAETVRQVAAQARQVGVPRPDDTFAALATAGAGR